MEQFLLQLPKRLAQEVRASLASSDGPKVEMISEADNKHFKLVVNGKQHSAVIAQLPTIIETHKTYDDSFLYKSGEIGQIFVVTDKDDERQLLEQTEELPHGITPPNTSVVKRKYAKTRRYTPFPKPEVARVEEDLVKMIQGGPYEEVQEELVDFCEWMVDEDHPNGVTFTDEMELVRLHPEYLELSSQASSKDSNAPMTRTSDGFSAINTPIATDVGSEVDSQGGLESAQQSPAPTPSQGMSPRSEDKDVDDFEDDLLRDMEEKAPAPPAPAKKSYLEDPAYLQLIATRDRVQKSVRDAERSVSDYAMKVEANSNIVMKNRIKQMMETAQKQRDEYAAELDKVQAQIREMERS